LIEKCKDEQKRVKEEAISDAERPLPVNHLERFNHSNGLEYQAYPH
jgi:hypothetical protein